MRSPLRVLHSLALAAGLGLLPYAATASDTASPGRDTAVNDPAQFLAGARVRAEAALGRADLAAYRGWIKYLRYLADTAAAHHGVASTEARAAGGRLDEWVTRITADPNLLGTLRGVQEWAYESPVDDSGQPFKIAIPTDYDAARPPPLSVYMHGYSGNHLEHSTGMTAHPGPFEVAVLGRARGSGYRALSEADVLHVIDYVQAHWAIDPDRVHINGGSMGGGATFRLGARYPHRWASGRPTCGYASLLPVGNLLTLPIYATHSDDDWVVPVLNARGPLARLRELGGQAILDETTGYGHAVWNYAEGNRRGDEWVQRQVRPDARTVRRIDYTALDGAVVRGWWAEIAEWGPAPKPARFVLTAGSANTLFAELINITCLRLRLAESPFDPAQPLRVAVNGAVPIVLPAPLPETIVLARTGKSWTFESKPDPAPFRLHTPGGANLLYDGEPLLIVYGTRGSGAERAALRAAAEAASKSSNCQWLDDSGPTGTDGLPHTQNLYGRLNTKADTAVTETDLARCHLVLIGTAAQNAVVARLADRLPVRLANGAIACSDGMSLPAAGCALGLVHYNPLAPDRLVFWVASDDPAAYAPNSAIPFLMAGGAANAVGVDLLVMRAGAPTLVAARSFDSRWQWTPGRDTSPLAPASLKTHRDLSSGVNAAIRRAIGADFGMTGDYAPPDRPAIVTGTTRVSDLQALFYYVPIGVIEMSGAELIETAHRISSPKDSSEGPVYLEPPVKAGKVDPVRTYRVALPVDLIPAFAAVTQTAPRGYRATDLLVGDAVERFLAAPE